MLASDAKAKRCHLKNNACSADNCMAWVSDKGPAFTFGKEHWTVSSFVKAVCNTTGACDAAFNLRHHNIIKCKGNKLVPSYLHFSKQELAKVPWEVIALDFPYSNPKPTIYGYCKLIKEFNNDKEFTNTN